MTPIAILAAGAVSALGRGRAAYAAGELGDAARPALSVDGELGAAGMRPALVGRVQSAAVDQRPGDRAELLLATALADLALELDSRLPRWRTLRVAVVLGTSAGGMPSIERALAQRAAGEELALELARGASYFGPLARVPSLLGLEPLAVHQILAACASSTLAVGLGCRWLEAGHFDVVLAGGYDALSAFVYAGFESLGALTESSPRPFRDGRDGMALGEGAAVLALVRPETASPVLGRVLGFGASSDAVHVTAPDAKGRGLAQAALDALADSAITPEQIDLVSAHATATPFNDAAESVALGHVFGERPLAVHPFKAVIGHTLGAAGALELLAALDALERRIVPAAAGEGTPCAAHVRLEPVNTAASLERALKLSSAFGGANAALVLGRADGGEVGSARPARAVALRAAGSFVVGADAERVLRWAPAAERWIVRADSVSELVLAAVARLLDELGAPLGAHTALVIGTASATLEVDDAFDGRRRAGRAVEPRRFPATSPNLCAGLCSIVFGLRGPSLAVGGSVDAMREALLIGFDLVAGGDADAALVVAVEDAGQVVEALFGAAGYPVPRRGASAALLTTGASYLNRSAMASHPMPPDPDLSNWFATLAATNPLPPHS